MATFYAAGEFPSFKPIRATAGKILELTNAKLAVTSDAKVKAQLQAMKNRLEVCSAEKQIFLTIDQANLVGIV